MSQNRSRMEEITDLLQTEILTGQYRPGERLPSERELAVRFEASRGAIREALKKLEQLGIAIVTPGGVRVVPIEEATLSVLGPLVALQEIPDPDLVGHLIDVLGALISMAAGTAMSRATEEELQAMQEIVRRLSRLELASEEQQQGWQELGTLFTQSSNNLVMRLILNGLKTHFIDRIQQPRPTSESIDEQQRLELLQSLADGLSNRDAKRVANTIIEHFNLVKQAVQDRLREVSQTSNLQPQMRHQDITT